MTSLPWQPIETAPNTVKAGDCEEKVAMNKPLWIVMAAMVYVAATSQPALGGERTALTTYAVSEKSEFPLTKHEVCPDGFTGSGIDYFRTFSKASGAESYGPWRIESQDCLEPIGFWERWGGNLLVAGVGIGLLILFSSYSRRVKNAT